MAEFQQYAAALLASGYLPIPIKPGEKRPALQDWEQLTAEAIANLKGFASCGLGLLTGQGAEPLCAIDIDSEDAELVTAVVGWCQTNIGMPLARTGRAPKTLLLYRAAEAGWRKITGAWFEDGEGRSHRVEVLGAGQQFVAFHEHPDTGRPYTWELDLSPLEIPASSLTGILYDEARGAVDAFDRLAQGAGLTRRARAPRSAQERAPTAEDPEDFTVGFERPLGLSDAEIRDALAQLDCEDYDQWLRVGMALHHERAGGADGLALWDGWSSVGATYKGLDDLEYRWAGFAVAQPGRARVTMRTVLSAARAAAEEAERTTKVKVRAELRELIAVCPDTIDLLGPVARRAAQEADGDMALVPELIGLLQKRFRQLTGTALPIASARRALSAPVVAATSSKQARPRTEFGLAERMLDRYGSGLMYVPEIEAWHSWQGAYWKRASMTDLEHCAKETVKTLIDEARNIDNDDDREAALKFAAVSQKAATVQHVVRLASSDPRVATPMVALDGDPDLFGVANGAVDLRTGRLLPPDPKHRITITSDVEYAESAACPVFEQTVADVFFGDSDMVSFFQRLVGYSLLGTPKEQILVIPYGNGCNGKSTVLGAVREALGAHAKMASSETFLSSDKGGGSGAGGAREDILRLRGTRFVYVTEPSEGSELRENLIKAMTGGEPIPCRGLYAKMSTEVKPSWVVVMPTNHKPIIRGDDHAIWRRIMLVPFTRNFDKDPTAVKDTDRAAKLRAELPGILRWCIEGAIAYRMFGLMPPAAVEEARASYRDDMDLLHDWLNECCELGYDYAVTSAALWKSWEMWARDRGELTYIRSSRTLSRKLSQRFALIKDACGISGRGLRGLRLASGAFE